MSDQVVYTTLLTREQAVKRRIYAVMCKERTRIKADYAAKSAECRKLRARLMRIARHWRPE